MASTYTLISSNTLSSSAASVTFSSIPSTYTDLVLRVSARSDAGASGILTLNADSGTTHSRTLLNGNGATAASLRSTGLSYDPMSYGINDSSYTANTFSNAEVYYPNYAGSTNKPSSVFAVEENNATTSFIGLSANLWSNTSAITQIVITVSGGNLVTGSSFYLYGIKNS